MLVLFCTLFFLTSCDTTEPLTFFTLGDWGHPSSQQRTISKVMSETAETNMPKFILSVGDNFYEDGVKDIHDRQWKSSFEDVYPTNSLNAPWYSLLGNHDYHQNPDAQIEYYKKAMDGRWTMPDFYYTKTFSFGQGSTLQIVAIDTIALAPTHTIGLLQEKVNQGVLNASMFVQIVRHLSTRNSTTQLQWIEETLANSAADWLLVAGHYPIYSGGEHGNTPQLQSDLKPLLIKYKVNAYLCGHDHNLQFLQNEGVSYVNSGSGAKLGTYKAIPQSVWGKVAPGFTRHTVSLKEMKVDYVTSEGIAFSTTINNLRQKKLE